MNGRAKPAVPTSATVAWGWICAAILVLFLAQVKLRAAEEPPTTDSLSSMGLEQLMEVTVVSAALHHQDVRDAPANVTVITASDIRKFGYRTLGEALESVPGFYITTDRADSYLGARGLSVPGDYGSRFLLLLNGHSLADPIYDASAYLEQEFPIELSLIKQIEIVHGPASALYGSNAVICTVNVITKVPSEMPRMSVTADIGNQGVKKLNLAYAGAWKGVRALVSGAVFNYGGEHSIYIPGYNAPATNFGRAINVDGRKGYHFFADVTWRNWTFDLMSGVQDKMLPSSYVDAIFNDRGNRASQGNSFAEVTYTKDWTRSQLVWNLSYSDSSYLAFSRLQLDDGQVEDYRDVSNSDWINSKLTYRFNAGHFGRVTVGAETQLDLEARQQSFDLKPLAASFVDINMRDKRMGYFAQQELELSKHWKAVLGARLDTSQYRDNSLSPRAGLIWAPSRRTALKFLYGTSFRNPNTYEMFYTDGSLSAANASLRPELGRNFEIVGERQLIGKLKLSGSAYRTDFKNLIVAGINRDGLFQFQNFSGSRLLGASAEVTGRIGDFDVGGSVAIQNDYKTTTRSILSNSPRQVSKVRFAVPVFRNHLTAAGALNWLGRRQDISGNALPSAMKADFTLTTNNLVRGFDLQFGVRNLFNQHSYDPAPMNQFVGVMPRPGRALFVRLIWRADD